MVGLLNYCLVNCMNLFILNFDSKSFEPCKHNISLIQHAVGSTDCYVRYVSFVSKTIIIEYFKNEAKPDANKNYILDFRFKKHCS